MRAWQLQGFGIDHLMLRDIPKIRPGPDEVLVRVHAVSLNYRDLLTIQGSYNPKMTFPSVPCSDAAGEIVEVGHGVSSNLLGQRVSGIFMQNWLEGEPTPERCSGALGGDAPGVLSEYAIFKQHSIVFIPQHLSYIQAATLPCAGVTAWNAVMHAAELRKGDVVLIQGTGGVSIFALQFAKLAEATVLGISSSDQKLERARDLGLDAGINYKQYPAWSKWVLQETQGAGARLIIEVGGAGTLNQSLRAICVGGTIAQIGVLAGADETVRIPLILHRQLHIKGIYVGSRERFQEMNRTIEKHSLHPVVDNVFPFSDVFEAFHTMKSGAHFGKIVIQVVP